MKDWIKNKPFVIGFIIGFVLFLIVNFYTVKFSEEKFLTGFPLTFYAWSVGFFYLDEKNQWAENHFIQYYVWNGIADLFIGIIFSFIFGLVFKFIWSKFTPKHLK